MKCPFCGDDLAEGLADVMVAVPYIAPVLRGFDADIMSLAATVVGCGPCRFFGFKQNDLGHHWIGPELPSLKKVR